MAKMNKDLEDIDIKLVERERNNYLFGNIPNGIKVIDQPIKVLTSAGYDVLEKRLKAGFLRLKYEELSYFEAEFVLMNFNAYLDADEKAIIVKPYLYKQN